MKFIAAGMIGILYFGCFADADFSFVVIGDTRPPFGSSSYANFQRQIDRINSFSPAFVVNCGDLIYGYGGAADEKAWDAYRQVITAVKVPYHQVPGNHDVFSRKAEKIYNELFKPAYYSFNRGGCHFVLLDNTEHAQWGFIGDTQFTWLKKDLAANTNKTTFVFMHLPNWIKEKTNKKFYGFWKETLHPLFRLHGVKAVFAGHIHSYGPTKRFDEIDYYITGGGGAELARWYKAHGGDFHFMLVKVSGGRVSHQIVTDGDMLNEEQADVVRNVEFDRDNATGMSVDRKRTEQRRCERFSLSLTNPSAKPMTGGAVWKFDPHFFKVKPEKISLSLGPKAHKDYSFEVKLLNDQWYTSHLPQLGFSVQCDSSNFVFSKELVFRQALTVPKIRAGLTIDGDLQEWQKAVPVILVDQKSGRAVAEVLTAYDRKNLYIGAAVMDTNALGPYNDTLVYLQNAFVIALDRSLRRQEHSNDDLQLEITRTKKGVNLYNRSTGDAVDPDAAGIDVAVSRFNSGTLVYEIALPQSFLSPMKLRKGTEFGLDFAVCRADSKGRTELFAWTPGIEIDGLDEGFQSQLHFAEAELK